MNNSASPPLTATEPADAVSAQTLGGLLRYFLKLGTSGFGGPIALVGYMQRDLVEQRGWFSETEYRQGLALAQTMPGPLAAQLAMWFGYLQAGVLGAAAVAAPFVLPPCLLVTGVAVLYARYQGLSVVHEIFLGVGPAVLAIIAIAAYKLARTTNKSDPLLWGIAAVVCAVTAIAKTEIVWLFLAAGVFGLLYYGGGLPRWRPSSATSFMPAGLLAVARGFSWMGSGSLGTMSLFFVKASAFTFGSGLAIVPFLHQGLVHDHHWLTEQQFVDAVAMGLISPGPVVIMATFAGYLVGGIAGALLATAAVFLPVYLFVIVPGPLLRRHGEQPRLQGFIKGATAAAAGAIAGAAIVIGEQVIATAASVAIALAALALLLQRRYKVPEPALVAIAAIVGLLALR
jgi:chromate transporter